MQLDYQHLDNVELLAAVTIVSASWLTGFRVKFAQLSHERHKTAGHVESFIQGTMYSICCLPSSTECPSLWSLAVAGQKDLA